jgi:hypothetical protein
MTFPWLRNILTLLKTFLPALCLCSSASFSQTEEECRTYPDEVHAQAFGWYDCEMKRGGELPLWKGGTDKQYVRQFRFAFKPGRQFTQPSRNFFRVIRFNERADGTGVVETVKYVGRDDRQGYRRTGAKRFAVSEEDTRKLNALGEQSGTWGFETGSWDGDEIYLHCSILEMERIDKDGYRYSSVKLQPTREAHATC